VQPLLPAQVARPLLQIYLLTICGTYFIYCWMHGGQTLPMKTWRIRVVAHTNADPTMRQAVIRFLGALVSIAAAGGGFWWALIDRDGQFLHDRIAGTRIIADERRLIGR
jgi:uncharacterized RDD family membrane protein YckC